MSTPTPPSPINKPKPKRSEEDRVKEASEKELDEFKDILSDTNKQRLVGLEREEEENKSLVKMFYENPELFNDGEKYLLGRKLQINKAIKDLNNSGYISDQDAVNYYKDGQLPQVTEEPQNQPRKDSSEQKLGVEASKQVIENEIEDAVWEQMANFNAMSSPSTSSIAESGLFDVLAGSATGVDALNILSKGFDVLNKKEDQNASQDINRNTSIEKEIENEGPTNKPQ